MMQPDDDPLDDSGMAPDCDVGTAIQPPFETDGVRGRLTSDAPLAKLVWFKTGGAADWLFEPEDMEDLKHFLSGIDRATPVMALGLGSNLIVRDGGVPGVVIKLGKPFADVEVRDNHVVACGGGGARYPRCLDRARCGRSRNGIHARHSRHGRRVRPHEWRCLWPRSG